MLVVAREAARGQLSRADNSRGSGFCAVVHGNAAQQYAQSNVPYLMTSYHCYDEDRVRTEEEVQAVANSLSTYWFFDATACGSGLPAAFKQVGGGATLLYRAVDLDFILLQMRNDAPPGAWFSAGMPIHYLPARRRCHPSPRRRSQETE
jgi:hypothetical protein